MKLLFEIDKKDYEPKGEVFSRPSARAIILKDGKLAAIYSRKHSYYKIPGGGVEPGEDNVTAMMREVREEVGLVVLPDSVKEFGYVHRIQKGMHEPVFVQDNFYYICDVEAEGMQTELSENEREEDFVPVWVKLSEAIRVNEEYVKANSLDSMIERELGVMRLVADMQDKKRREDKVFGMSVGKV